LLLQQAFRLAGAQTYKAEAGSWHERMKRLIFARLFAFFFVFLLLLFLLLHRQLVDADLVQSDGAVAFLSAIGRLQTLDSLGTGQDAALACETGSDSQTFIHCHDYTSYSVCNCTL